MGTYRARRVSNFRSLIVLACTGAIAAPALAKDQFTLPSAVPADVFLCVAGRHNPEADFVSAYWDRVCEAFEASGITDEALGMLSSVVDEKDKAEFDRLKALATQLWHGVDWDALGDGEGLFAIRMPKVHIQGDDMNVGMSDMLWILKGTAGSGAKNFEGMTAILDAIAAEVNKVAGSQEIKIDKAPIGAAKAISMGGQNDDEDEPSLNVALHDDVIVISIGKKIIREAVELLGAKGGSAGLGSTARYKDAFKSLPEAENAVVFMDMQRMLQDLHAITEAGFSLGEKLAGSAGVAKRAQMPADAKAAYDQAYAAYMMKDYAQALILCEKAHDLAPGNPMPMYNLACFHNLSGHKDEALTWLEKAAAAGFDDAKLLNGDDDLASLRSEARFQAVTTKVGAAVAAAPKPAEGSGDPEQVQQIRMAKTVVNRLLDAPAMVDYIAEVEFTDGNSTHNESFVSLTDDASANAFYPVVGNGKPIGAFATYIPQEATSFSVASGIDLNALYTYLEDTVKSVGPQGEAILTQWAQMQQEKQFDIRKDLLSWIGSETVSFTMQRPTGEATVSMMKVGDETIAAEKLNWALEHVAALIQQLQQQNPMMGMFSLRSSPCLNEKLKGFRNLFMGMTPQPMVVGVANGYLMFGSTEDAVITCLATASGEHPNVTTNAEVMAQMIKPDAGACSASFQDMRQLGSQLAAVTGMVSMFGGMAAMAVPDPKAQAMIGKFTALVGKLSPVLQKIDFYRSKAATCNFDGKSWRTKSVTHYRSPSEAPPVAATPAPTSS